ncbi:MAG: hypothetical protein C4520_06200 [Candidatus Abyssobacteria bacterium SURF_5]|uniref:DUF2393 domain-containing protein n=1 Tax=Abyssobacteria bacterium (strain SURF_5) TaxID=2093360 RepID=A0A3A4NX44_ABYX5|nr:MAG: hypothetical protein C4520_06200 [Candidatus Abyssubacteria bacterium SURF_5]
MQETESGQERQEQEGLRTTQNGFVIGVVAATGALAVVLFLMAHAVRQSVPARAPQWSAAAGDKRGGQTFLTIERLNDRFLTNAAGIAELEITGVVRNSGPSAVETADLKCHFKTREGREACMEIPLIVDSRLDGFEARPLDPFSTRRFSARVADFPDALEPELFHAELVNIGLSSF